MKTARQIVREVTERLHPGTGCTDGGCVFGHPGGVRTNGGCACLRERNAVQLKRYVMIMADVACTLAAVNGETR